MLEKIAMIAAIAGLGMVMVIMIGQEYDSQMINIAWVIIAVKMADLTMILLTQGFYKNNQIHKSILTQRREEDVN